MESSLTATNKALKSAGYKLADLTSDADRARQRNNQLDRQGGGPVPWSQFYGTTAKDFFYHPTDDNTIHVNPVPVDQRPPQFDYIYRANEDNRAKAEAAAAAVGNKIDDLLAHRKTLEAEQLSLWCKIAFRGVASQEFSTRPLYRFDPITTATGDAARQHVDAIKAGADFLKAVDAAIARAQAAVGDDQKSALDDLLRATTTARMDVDARLLRLPGIATELADTKSPIGQFRQASKRLQDFAENMTDAYRLSTAADVDEDPGRKSSSRGQFQRAVSSYSEAVIAADKSLDAAAKAWSVTADTSHIPAPVDPGTTAANTVPAKLEAARAEYMATLAKARQTLVAAIDARMNAAADSGDLSAVESLQLAKISAARDGSVTEDAKDPSIVSAKARYDQAVATANHDLASAYHQAIRDYTKARQFTEAKAAQDELNAANLGDSRTAAADGSAPVSVSGNGEIALKPGPMIALRHSLPPFLVGNEFSSEGDGIVLNSPVQTRAADLLSKDFIFDVECDRKDHGVPLFVGLSQGIAAPDPKTTAIKVYPTHEGGGGFIGMGNNDNCPEMGHLPEPGKCLIRVEKIGRTVIFSIGTVEDGKFMPQLSREVVDIHAFNPDLQDKTTHLYIQGGKGEIFTRVSLTTAESNSANQSRREIPFGSFSLQRTVPGFLTGLTCNVMPDGLIPNGERLQSISPAVLSKNFTCDVAFSYHKHTTGWFGVGQAGTGDRPEKFVGIRIQAGDAGHQVFYFNHSGENGKDFGETTEAGSYIARMTKQGQELTFLIGTGEGAAFKPIASRTIGDLGSFDSDLNTANTHLFIGGNVVFSNITLSPPISEGASIPSTPPSPPSPPSANGGGNAQPAGPGEPHILGNGSGFFIAPDGYILTDKNVAAAGDYLLVRLPDNSLQLAERVVLDDEQDMAVIKVKTAALVPFIRLAGYEHPAMGADVAVFGFPIQAVFGLKASVKMTRGIVTAWDGDNKLCDVTVDAAVNPGNSGGPMVDRRGNLLALTAMKTVALDGDVSLSSYGLGYSTGRIRKFFKKQHDKLAAANLTDGSDKAPELTNEELAARLTPCTVCILVGKGTPPDLGSGTTVPPVVPHVSTPAARAPKIKPVKNDFTGLYRLVNKESGRYLTILGHTRNAGDLLGVSSRSESDFEKWSLNSIKDYDGVKLVNHRTNRCAGVRQDSKKPGSDVLQWSDWNSAAVHQVPEGNNWKLDRVGDNFRIVNEVSGQCLSESNAQANRVEQQPWTGSDAQLWRLEAVK